MGQTFKVGTFQRRRKGEEQTTEPCDSRTGRMPFTDLPKPWPEDRPTPGRPVDGHSPQSAPQRRLTSKLTTVVGLLATSSLVIFSSSVVGARLTWNLTDSMPRGIYWRCSPRGRPEFRLGDFVLLPVPSLVQQLIDGRSYLPAGARLLKRVVAVPGDNVCFQGEVFRVNGTAFAQILTTDSLGRALPISAFCGSVPREFVIVGTTAVRSIDSRNFGPVPESQLEGARAAMDVVTLILACSLYPDDAMVRALISVQSQDNPYFVGDLATLKTSDSLMSTDAALVETYAISRKDGRPAVGLLGVPADWARQFDKEVKELFDPCTNIEVGTAMLSEFEAECPRPKPSGNVRGNSNRNRIKASRSCVLRKFAGGLGLTGAPAAVLAHLAPFRPSAARSIASAPVFRQEDWKEGSTSPDRSRNEVGGSPED